MAAASNRLYKSPSGVNHPFEIISNDSEAKYDSDQMARLFVDIGDVAPSKTFEATLSELGTDSARERNGMSEHPTKDEMKSEMRASVAEVETKIVRIEGEINTALATIVTKLDALSTDVERGRNENKDNRYFILGSAIALGALFIAVVTYGDSVFERGMQVRDVVKSVVEDMKPAVQPKVQ